MLVATQGQSEEDEKRPYKFAFAIEGYQHRSEEKDERGIIMGEFGFVTGDGVYHVTVYATDENGDFKILKMKSYYIGLPGEGTTAAPTRAPTTQAPSTTKSPILQHLEGLMGCSGCLVPDKKNGNGANGVGLIDERFGASPGQPVKPAGGEPTGVTGGLPGGSGPSSAIPGAQKTPAVTQPGSLPQYNRPSGVSQNSGFSPSRPGGVPMGPSQDRFGGIPSYEGGAIPGGPQTPKSPSLSPGQSTIPGAPLPASRPGDPQVFQGLPPGMSMVDLMALLYKFNYTLKYHGHHESGYRNGDKEGGYFFNGRDGLGRNVVYLANEFGFQPNITLVDLGLQAPDTPKGENEENELRGNEFKWFYKRK